VGDNEDMAALQRDTRKRGATIGMITGGVLILFGIALSYFGGTFEEPAERLATRSVPAIAPIALVIGGVGLAIAGLVFVVRGLRKR